MRWPPNTDHQYFEEATNSLKGQRAILRRPLKIVRGSYNVSRGPQKIFEGPSMRNSVLGFRRSNWLTWQRVLLIGHCMEQTPSTLISISQFAHYDQCAFLQHHNFLDIITQTVLHKGSRRPVHPYTPCSTLPFLAIQYWAGTISQRELRLLLTGGTVMSYMVPLQRRTGHLSGTISTRSPWWTRV